MSGQEAKSGEHPESDKASESTKVSDKPQVDVIDSLSQRVDLSKSDETYTKVKVFTFGDGGFGIAGMLESTPDASEILAADGVESSVDYVSPIEYADASCEEGARNEWLASADVQRVFERNFETLDTDGNGYISESEIDQAMTNPCFKGEDAQLLVALKRSRTDLEELSNDELLDEDDGITRADMAAFHAMQSKDDMDDDERQLLNNVRYAISKAYHSIEAGNKANRKLFANEEDPLESIKPDAVCQGIFNNCYFLAPLAAMANSPEGKKAIYDMINDNEDGTYTVTFPGDPEHPVVVTAPTDAELGAGAAGSTLGIWAAVLEKAYGRHEDPDAVLAHNGMPDYSKFSTAMELLTGREVDTDNILFTSLWEIHEDLQAAINAGKPVKAFNWTNEEGIPGSHVYSVLGYDPKTQMVKIRNPWGNTEPTDVEGNAKDGVTDGVFEMPLWWFAKNFTTISYGQ